MAAIPIQISELEMLQSMFSPSELRIAPSLLEDMKSCIDSPHATYPLVSFTINLDVEIKLEVSVTLPPDYPAVEPEIFVRSELLDRQEQSAINKELNDYVSILERGEVCIYSAISWLQENAHRFKQHEPVKTSSVKINSDKLVRIWIYSHHIYNKDKRRNILGYASQHCCAGFMLPGRPGVICLEGYEDDCDEVWRKIRSMNWKKIMLKKKEECTERCFTTFEETSFNKCKDERHMDMGEFFKYLENHNCGYIFKEYFGVDGKIPTEDD
ncbi:RWD domain-containing protein 2B [Frankliniella fusca]|uniref:RWD domain-containing protein 2B n=1 Tax=Frankliniella fusca TaxID=407009 RepID=A0AAE1H6H2_9NEOP|nr:RWD domain-containing protein 2B [Frankliniella fusca]